VIVIGKFSSGSHTDLRGWRFFETSTSSGTITAMRDAMLEEYIAFGYSVASDERHCWGCGESTERSAGKSGWKWDVPAVYLNLEYGDPRDVAMQKVVQGM
jgi:hypothetical protein